MGVPDALAHGSLRFGLGRGTTREEVDFAIERVRAAVRRLRGQPPAVGSSGEAFAKG
jgi:cysteine desulfurase